VHAILCRVHKNNDYFLYELVTDGRDITYPDIDMQSAIGQYVNCLPVIITRNTASSFAATAAGIQEVYLEARLNQEMPVAYINEKFRERYGVPMPVFRDAHFNFFDLTDQVIDAGTTVSDFHIAESKEENTAAGLSCIVRHFKNALIIDWQLYTASHPDEYANVFTSMIPDMIRNWNVEHVLQVD
jgi:hypothetical protein